MTLNDLDFEKLLDSPKITSDLVFRLDGMTADEYIAKLTDEINKIELDSIPFDKWDYIVAFSLALVEVAGDFFIGDPKFKYSLANKNGPFVQWMKQFHDKIAHPGSPLDFQGPGFGGPYHRGNTFGHDSLPISRLLYGKGEEKDDSNATKSAKKDYNGFLLLRDIISMGFAIYCISSGTFIDCGFTKDGVYKWVVTTVNQNGTPYDSCNIFVAVIKYLKHMLADFCSSTSLPIPGFSFLTHWPDRDVEAFAMKLYKNGMNLRTMLLQGIPVAFTEIMMRVYMHCRYQDSDFSEFQVTHKQNKLLLVSHGITTAVNVGKVCISGDLARLNLLLIARTFYLIWKVVDEEMMLTNHHILKYNDELLKVKIESSKTLVLLDELLLETDNLNQLVDELDKRIKTSIAEQRAQMDALDDATKKLDSILED